jgi:hypothetical protein
MLLARDFKDLLRKRITRDPALSWPRYRVWRTNKGNVLKQSEPSCSIAST